MKFSGIEAFLDVRVGLLGALLGLDELGGEDLCLLLASRHYPLTGQNCPDRTCQSDLEVREGNSPHFPFFYLIQRPYFCSSAGHRTCT